MSDLAQSITLRHTAMSAQRDLHVDVWRRCYKFTYPLRAHGFFGEEVTASNGLDQLAELTDSTTIEAVRIFVAHLIEGMTPSNALWFGLDVGRQTADEKRWLSIAAKLIWENIHNSNFDAVAFESMIDGVCAGWFVMYCEEAETGGYHFEGWPLSECCIGASRSGRPIDTIYRSFELTAEQALNEYGDACSSKIKEAVENNKPHDKFKFIHAIYPNKTYVVGARLAKNMRFKSCHVELASKTVVRESGYHEFPCAVPRWQVIPGGPYAVGPVYDALPEAATINKVKHLELANLDLATAGMWIAEDDGVLNPRSIKIGARRVIVANSVDSMKALQPSADFNVTFLAEDRIQNQIRKLLLADILPPLEGQPRTATEMNIRMAYLRQMFGPVFARLQSEYLQRVIERCFGIAMRAGVLGTPPESLLNRTWHVKYKSPLARAQSLAEVDAIDQYVAGLAQLQEIDAGSMDNVDLDKAARFRADALGVPADIIPSEDVVKQRRQAREEARRESREEAVTGEVVKKAAPDVIKKLATRQ